MKRLKLPLLFLILCVLTVGCQKPSIATYLKNHIRIDSPPHDMALHTMDFTQLDNWEKANFKSAFDSFNRSCATMLRYQKDVMLSAYAGTYEDWTPVCQAAQKLSATLIHPSDIRAFFESRFTPYSVTDNGSTDAFLTGYYEAHLRGSYTRSETYHYPLYALPPKSHRHHTRKAIDGGALDGLGLELVYVDDPVELFFLHVQGSGRVLLDDGSTLRVGYAGQNGERYKSIGRHLVDEGVFTLENITAEKIKQWLRTHKKQQQYVLHTNPSYIYFTTIEGPGPIGSQGIALTPEASVAVDKRFIPLGVPLWINTTSDGQTPYFLLAIAQDTGGAIKGTLRGDIFFGFGPQAQEKASQMKYPGSFIMLLPNEVTPSVHTWQRSNTH